VCGRAPAGPALARRGSRPPRRAAGALSSDDAAVVKRSRHALVGLLLFLPAAAVIFGFIFFPVGYSVWLSLTNKHAIRPDYDFIGMENYRELGGDADFWLSFWRGTVFSVGSIGLQIALGLVVALLLNQPFRGRGFVRGLALFPYMLPTIVVILIWKWLLSASYGPVNYVLQALGLIEAPVVWLGERWLMPSTIFVAVWQFFPFVVISLLARRQTIDLHLYEAAAIDGAGPWRRFAHVTLPALKNVLFVVVLLRTFFMFTKFDVPWLMATGGGLQELVQNLPVLAFRKTFRFFLAGEGAAISVALFALLVVLTAVYFRVYRTEAEA
jgi:multiple sugar transport system permease protein